MLRGYQTNDYKLQLRNTNHVFHQSTTQTLDIPLQSHCRSSEFRLRWKPYHTEWQLPQSVTVVKPTQNITTFEQMSHPVV